MSSDATAVTRTSACPACGSTRARQAFRRAHPTFRRCRDCATLFDIDPPTDEVVQGLYEGKAYFVKDDEDAHDAFWGYRDDYLADREFIDAKFEQVLQHVERYVPPGHLLDVGCGPGFLLAAAERRGWSGVGLDLNEWAAGYARDELGVDARWGALTAEQFEPASFDAVTLMDVIEHVPHPDALLETVSRVVRPGGAIVLLTPDAGSAISRLMGSRWPEVGRAGEHMVLYSVEGLSKTLARHGAVASGWHSIGKLARVATLLADAAPLAPSIAERARKVLEARALGQRTVEFDPRTKFCLYARKLPDGAPPSRHEPVRIPRRPDDAAALDEDGLDREIRSRRPVRRAR